MVLGINKDDVKLHVKDSISNHQTGQSISPKMGVGYFACSVVFPGYLIERFHIACNY